MDRYHCGHETAESNSISSYQARTAALVEFLAICSKQTKLVKQKDRSFRLFLVRN
jgi:hypothetical protein